MRQCRVPVRRGWRSLLAAAFALMPSVNQAYWILTATTTALLGFYYLPIFAAVIKLRYTQPEKPRQTASARAADFGRATGA